jgi:hypothetical protein
MQILHRVFEVNNRLTFISAAETGALQVSQWKGISGLFIDNGLCRPSSFPPGDHDRIDINLESFIIITSIGDPTCAGFSGKIPTPVWPEGPIGRGEGTHSR